MADRSFSKDFKRFFGRGLAILLPSILTLWILFQLGLFVFRNVAEPINYGIQSVVLFTLPRVMEEDRLPEFARVRPDEFLRMRSRLEYPEPELPPGPLAELTFEQVARGLTPAQIDRVRDHVRHRKYDQIWDTHWALKLIGLAVAIVAIYLAGLLLGNYIGRSVYSQLERVIARVPGFKQIYPHVKQVVDLIFGEDKAAKAFNEVVLVEYPGQGCWTIGLVTGQSFQLVRDQVSQEMVSVFIPTSPTPMTGFVINVKREDARHLDMTVDQAIRFVVTAGVLTPDSARRPAASVPESAMAKGLTPAASGVDDPAGPDRQAGTKPVRGEPGDARGGTGAGLSAGPGGAP